MRYYDLTVACPTCEQKFFATRTALNAAGDVILTARCDNCKVTITTEGTISQMVYEVQMFELETRLLDPECYDLESAILREVVH